MIESFVLSTAVAWSDQVSARIDVPVAAVEYIQSKLSI